MGTFEVRRQVETVVTGHAASTGVAKREAADAAKEAIAAVAGSELAAVETEATAVHEFPSGPFDPYRTTVAATITVTVDAADESAATTAGEEAIEGLLDRADLDGWEYSSDSEVRTTV